MQNLLIELYETIARYHAIGLDFESYLNQNSNQRRRFGEIVANKFESREYDRWMELINKIQPLIPGFSCLSPSQNPGLFGQALVEGTEWDHMIFQRFINLEVSLFGPYYFIHFTEYSSRKSGERSLPTTIISNVREHGNLFNELTELFSSIFSGYKMIPFRLLSFEIKGLDVNGIRDSYGGRIYHGIFNNNDDILKGRIIDDLREIP